MLGMPARNRVYLCEVCDGPSHSVHLTVLVDYELVPRRTPLADGAPPHLEVHRRVVPQVRQQVEALQVLAGKAPGGDLRKGEKQQHYCLHPCAKERSSNFFQV
jgi:hypothetical protein